MNFKRKLLICLFAISLIFCSDFSSFVSENKSISKSITELEEILQSFNFKNLMAYTGSWEYREPGLTYDSYLRIDSFNLTNIAWDLTKFAGSFNPFVEITSNGNRVFQLNYEFKYIGRTSFTSKFVGTGRIRISDYSFRFTKNEGLDGKTKAALLLGLTVSCELVNGNKDDKLLNYFARIKSDQTSMIKAKLIQGLNSYLDAYYAGKDHDNTINFETIAPNFSYTYTFNFQDVPSYQKDNGVTFYYKGNLKRNNIQIQNNLPKKASEEYVFNPKDGDNQVLISYSLLRTLFSDFSTTKELSFELSEKTMIPDYKFLLNVDFLGQVVPGIYVKKAKDEKLHIKGQFSELDYNDQTTTLSTRLIFTTYDSSNVAIFAWTNDLQFVFEPDFDLAKNSLNFRIKQVLVTDTTITQNDFGEADVQTLSGWVQDSLDAVALKYVKNLFKQSVDITKFFRAQESRLVPNQGILLIGN